VRILLKTLGLFGALSALECERYELWVRKSVDVVEGRRVASIKDVTVRGLSADATEMVCCGEAWQGNATVMS
jgi:hypothetical protein